MNTSIIKSIVFKDWYFIRWPLAGYLTAGLIGLVILAIWPESGFYLSLVLIISAIIVVGAHLIFTTVIGERKSKTLPFLMGLPINYRQYTSAKMITNLVGFTIPWLILTVGAVTVILLSDLAKDGLIPFIVIILTELLVANILVFTVAMVSESEAWAIVVMAICNIGVSLFSMFIGGFSEINQYMQGDLIVWNSTAITMLLAEIIIAVGLIAITYVAQSQKKNFL